MTELIKNHFDFLLLYLYYKDNGEFITKLMKIYQIFTSFDKYKRMSHFHANKFGGLDSQLQNAIYSHSNYFPIDFIGENDNKKKVKLNPEIKKTLSIKLDEFIEKNEEAKEDIIFIQKLAILSSKYNQDEIIKFCYYFWPDLAKKSTIINTIANIKDDVIREIIKSILLIFPENQTFEFLKLNISKIVDLSLLSPQNKSQLEVIIKEMLDFHSMDSLLGKTKEYFLSLLENTSDNFYKEILRKSINLIIFNKERGIEENFMRKWLIVLLKLEIEYNQEYYDDFIKFLNNSNFEFSINSIEID